MRRLLRANLIILLILPVIFAIQSYAAEPLKPDNLEIQRGQFIAEHGSFLSPAWKGETWERLKATSKPLPDEVLNSKPVSQNDQALIRYGLHPAPFSNNNLPMGLRPAWTRDGRMKGLQIDCLLCHGGSIAGKSYVGLGNSTLDMVTFLNAMTRAENRPPPILTFNLNSSRGTVNAGQLSIVLFSLRNTDLSFVTVPLKLESNLPEQDVPAWWNIARKSTIYIDGRTSGESSRSIMQFYLPELTEDQFASYEPAFKDLLAYIRDLKPPKYPFPIDRAKADEGQQIFEKTCSKCHGTYGENSSYPDQVIDLSVIGTDPARAKGVSDKSIDHYNATWFGKIHAVDKTVPLGYQAPPLDGVWATAPYLHNGSVPTVYDLLNSSGRPARFLRHATTGVENFDPLHLGWKVRRLMPENPVKFKDSFQTRSIFDNSRYGLGNQGHTFGDRLTEAQRFQVIEYLKTL